MGQLENQLAQELAKLDQAGLRRSLRSISSPQGTEIDFEGRRLINFSSNDYLGLANHPAIKQAAQNAIAEFGTGTGASRLISGSNAWFHKLETALAKFKGTERALTFSTGYGATLGAIPSLVEKGDIILVDRLAHASIIDAARLSGASLRVFRHNDMDHLAKLLKWANSDLKVSGSKSSGSPANQHLLSEGSRPPRVLIATESIFSMDGDAAPLREMVELKNAWNALLFLDEAHATGLCGPQGKGWAHACGVAEHVDVSMGTLSKACGTSGGFVCGSSTLIEFLINRARTFLFSTAPMPACAAAAHEAISLISSEAGHTRRVALWNNIHSLASALCCQKPPQSAIFPVMMGSEQRASSISKELLGRGFLLPAIRFPTVPRGKARLRISLSSDHTKEQIVALAAALQDTCDKIMAPT